MSKTQTILAGAVAAFAKMSDAWIASLFNPRGAARGRLAYAPISSSLRAAPERRAYRQMRPGRHSRGAIAVVMVFDGDDQQFARFRLHERLVRQIALDAVAEGVLEEDSRVREALALEPADDLRC